MMHRNKTQEFAKKMLLRIRCCRFY